MPVRVINKATQKEAVVSAAEAQDGILKGALILADPKVAVVSPDNRVGDVGAPDLLGALGQGWRLVDDDEIRDITIKREESTIGAQALGTLESAAAGATLGLSTALETALGATPARMRARREAIGGLGTAAEVAGALAPALLTGGASAGAQAGARGLGARALGALPAGRLARAGAAIETGLATGIGEGGGLVRTLVPSAGRGMVEGFAAGVGQEVDESILGERDITAENLLANGGFAALLGGATGALIPGLAAAGTGAGRVAIKPIRQVMGRAQGLADELGDFDVARLVADPRARDVMSKVWGVPREEVDQLFNPAITPPDELQRLIQRSPQITEELADSLRPTFEGFRKARKIGIEEGTGAARVRDVARHLPDDADSLARIQTQGRGQIDLLDQGVAQEIDRIEQGISNLDRTVLKRTGVLVNQAEDDLARAADDVAAGKMTRRDFAAAIHSRIDDLKQSLDVMKSRYKGVVLGPADKETRDFLTRHSEALREHLQDTVVYGEAGARQTVRNSLMSEAIRTRDQLTGASARLLDFTGPIDNADLLTVVRNGSRFAGATKTELLEDAVEAESNYLRWVLQHGDIDDKAKTAIREQLAANKTIGETFEAQRKKVRKLDILERWRGQVGNRSPSIGLLSTPGPAIAAMAGGAIGGLPGAAIATAASTVTNPYIMTRKLATILAKSEESRKASMKAIASVVKKIGEGAALVGRTAVRSAVATGRVVGAVVQRGTPHLAADRKARLETVRENAARLATNPSLLADEIRKMTIDMEEDAPQLAREVGNVTHRGLVYLQSVAPRGYVPPMSNAKPMYDPIELDAYARRVEAVRYPDKVIAEIGTGTLTAEHIEAYKAVYPAKFDEVQRMILEAVSLRKEPLPLSMATQVSSLWGSPVDPTLPLSVGMAASFTAGKLTQQYAKTQSKQAQNSPKLKVDESILDTPLNAATKASHG